MNCKYSVKPSPVSYLVARHGHSFMSSFSATYKPKSQFSGNWFTDILHNYIKDINIIYITYCTDIQFNSIQFNKG